jgi:lipopolysaccharide export system permease protein
MKDSPKGLIPVKFYEHYFINKIVGPFLLITLAVTGIAWLSQSLKFIDFIVNKGLSIGDFLYLSTLILPSLFWIIVPAGTFISIIYTYNKLANDSELVIFRNAGVDNKSLMRPALVFCLLTTLISYVISLYLLPSSYRSFKDMQVYIRNNYASVLLQEGIFTNPVKGLTVYIKSKDSDGIMKGLIVHDNRNTQKIYTITAQSATMENTPNGPIFVLKNGSHQEYNKKTGKFSLLYFDSYNLVMDLFNKEMAGKRTREAPELYLHELFITFNNTPKKENMKNIAEGNYRITWPLYNVLLCLIALAPFVKGEFSRRGNTRNLIKISFIGIATIIFALLLKSIAVENIYMNILQYANVLGGITFCYYWLVSDDVRGGG